MVDGNVCGKGNPFLEITVQTYRVKFLKMFRLLKLMRIDPLFALNMLQLMGHLCCGHFLFTNHQQMVYLIQLYLACIFPRATLV